VDPDGRYGTITSVTAAATTASNAGTAAATAQTTASNAGTAAATAQSTANNAGTAAATAQTTANNAATAASTAQTAAATAQARADRAPALATAKAWNWNSLTTNTSLDFTSIPSWVKRITVMLNGISTNGSSDYFLRIGAGSFANTGYSGYVSYHNFNSPTNSARQFFSTGFTIYAGSAAEASNGVLQLVLLSGNTWILSGQIATDNYSWSYFGSITLSGILDRVQLVTNGTEVFDAGTINIMYE
jgi:hypothetical protein